MKNIKRNSLLLSSFLSITFLVACSGGGGGGSKNPADLAHAELANSPYIITHTNSYQVTAGAGKIITSEVQICPQTAVNCATTVLVYDQSGNLIKQLNSYNFSKVAPDMSLKVLEAAIKKAPLSSKSLEVDPREVALNNRTVNDQMLARCRFTKLWMKMNDLKSNYRDAFYFFYSSASIPDTNQMFRIDSKTGEVSLQKSKYDLVGLNEKLNLVVNAANENGELLKDNSLIIFSQHHEICHKKYDSKYQVLSPFDEGFDEEVSAEMDIQHDKGNISPYVFMLGASKSETTYVHWANKANSLQKGDKRYVRPDPQNDAYWQK